MQQRALLLLALVSVGTASRASTLANNAATAWLQSHKSPTDDQLGALSSANPAAFAIVSALLKKHAKGEIKLAPEERGPDVFRKMMTPRHFSAARPSADVPYANAELAEVSRPVVDQAHYNPNAAADRDESAVSRLLAAVAQMGGEKGKKIALLNHHRKKTVADNSLLSDTSIFADSEPAAPVEAVEAQVAAAVQPPVQEPAPAAPPAAKRENSYLKGIDLTGDMPVAATAHKQHTFAHDDSPNNLATFSFGDDVPAKPAPKKVAPPAKPKKDNVFLKWLSGTKKVEAPEAPEAKPAQPAARVNPYAGWLGN